MGGESSRKTEAGATLGPGGCPRCGTRLNEPYKYCPNCAYRLRPDLVPAPFSPATGATLGQRVVALGGYLLFAAMLLLVVFAGVRLFAEPEPPDLVLPQVIRARDADCLPLAPEDFVHVPAGNAFWGLYDPAVPREPEAALPEAYRVDDGFRMAAREVTNDQYFEFLRARARRSGRPVPQHMIPAHWVRLTGVTDVPRMYPQYQGDFPVLGVPFDAALEFCGWFWEERLGADPDLVVDLPSWKEYVLAARAEELTSNFPWGRTLHEGESVNLTSGAPWSVARENATYYHGFLDLVGNAAEWVYGPDEQGSYVAAGWSFEDAWVYKVYEGEAGQPARLATPFSSDGLRVVERPEDLRAVGFRPVIRRAPQAPDFVRVEAGAVRHGPAPEGLVPPERYFAEEPAEGEPLYEPAVSFEGVEEEVSRPFEIAASEVTNRQYLAFLVAVSPQHTKDRLWQSFVPTRTWRRLNRLHREDERGVVPVAYRGHYPPHEKIEVLYPAGQENVPVQGITIEQAEAYAAWLSSRIGRACAIPTVAQFVRAGRDDALVRYPWGEDEGDIELVSRSRPDYESRPFSLAELRVSPPRRIVGLVGNLAEFVREGSEGGRLLLAGGFYELPARLCTLDAFLDASWASVQFLVAPEDLSEEEVGARSPASPLRLDYHTGFRVVRSTDRF